MSSDERLIADALAQAGRVEALHSLQSFDDPTRFRLADLVVRAEVSSTVADFLPQRGTLRRFHGGLQVSVPIGIEQVFTFKWSPRRPVGQRTGDWDVHQAEG